MHRSMSRSTRNRFMITLLPLTLIVCTVVALRVFLPYQNTDSRRDVDETTTPTITKVSEVEKLRAKIKQNRLRTIRTKDLFVPDAVLGTLLSYDVVSAIIEEIGVSLDIREELVHHILNSSSKIFCILVWLRQVEAILELKDRKNTDLPLGTEEVKNIEGFYETQWEYLSPIFDRVYRKLHDNIILPFHSEEMIGKGGSGEVYKVKVYGVHQKSLRDFHREIIRPPSEEQDALTVTGNSDQILQDMIVVARKRVGNLDEFEIELETLEELGKLEHAYIIDLLGAYSKNDYSLIFPLAEMDLAKFMKLEQRHPQFVNDDSFYNSIIGLSHAIESIHNFTRLSMDGKCTKTGVGYHHDIKPGNILVRDGKFLLADFGLSRVSLDDNEISKTFRPGGTITYGAPECYAGTNFEDRPVGRSLDIWSFGCVLCVLATYMLLGREVVEEFVHHRKGYHSSRQYLDDAFHTSNKVKPEVEEWMFKLGVSQGYDDRMHHLLEGVKKMLVPEVDKRLNAGEVLNYLREIPSFKNISVDPLRLKGYDTAAGIDMQTRLERAVSARAEPVVRLLWKDGANPNTQNKEEKTVLDQAAAKGDGFMVQLLLEKGVGKEDVLTPTKSSALRHAAREGKGEVGCLLLEEGADPNDKDKEGRTALELATMGNHEDVVVSILNKVESLDIKSKRISVPDMATGDRNNPTGQKKPRKKADRTRQIPRRKVGPKISNTALSSALRLAAIEGKEDTVRVLLKHGASKDGQDNDGVTALHWGVRKGHEEVVRLLLEHGVDRNIRDKEKHTALDDAAISKNSRMIQLLLTGKIPDTAATTSKRQVRPSPLLGQELHIETLSTALKIAQEGKNVKTWAPLIDEWDRNKYYSWKDRELYAKRLSCDENDIDSQVRDEGGNISGKSQL